MRTLLALLTLFISATPQGNNQPNRAPNTAPSGSVQNNTPQGYDPRTPGYQKRGTSTYNPQDPNDPSYDWQRD